MCCSVWTETDTTYSASLELRVPSAYFNSWTGTQESVQIRKYTEIPSQIPYDPQRTSHSQQAHCSPKASRERSEQLASRMADFASQQRMHPTGAPIALERTSTRITLWEMNDAIQQTPGVLKCTCTLLPSWVLGFASKFTLRSRSCALVFKRANSASFERIARSILWSFPKGALVLDNLRKYSYIVKWRTWRHYSYSS